MNRSRVAIGSVDMIPKDWCPLEMLGEDSHNYVGKSLMAVYPGVLRSGTVRSDQQENDLALRRSHGRFLLSSTFLFDLPDSSDASFLSFKQFDPIGGYKRVRV
jgi:hypothetical protein